MSIFLLGFLLGMQHSLEADHLAAVTALVAGTGSAKSAAMQGACWGLGHTLTLMAFGGAFVLLDGLVPVATAKWLEIGVGVMLVGLGVGVLRSLRRKRVHIHRHQHDGVEHIHAHAHDSGRHERQSAHAHEHTKLSGKALMVGLMHGLAGSAALLILVLSTVESATAGLFYIAIFGLGSVLGMAVLSAALTLPLRWSAGQFRAGHRVVQGVLGTVTCSLGCWIIVSGLANA